MTIPRRAPFETLKPGVTLLELSVVIMVLLVFLGTLFVGIGAWKRGADRAGCIANIRHMQQSVRSYANMNGLSPGENTSLLTPPVNLNSEIVGNGRFIEEAPSCPGRGSYIDRGSEIPEIGTLYMTCSLATSNNHQPDSVGAW